MNTRVVKMQNSTEDLLKLLKTRYMRKDGAPNLDTAIRDCLTDLFHIAQVSKTDLHKRIIDAEMVFKAEKIHRLYS